MNELMICILMVQVWYIIYGVFYY